MAIPTFYIVASPKDRIQGAGHQLDCMIIPIIDNVYEVNLRDYIEWFWTIFALGNGQK